MTTEEVLESMTSPELRILMAELDRTLRELRKAGRPTADTWRLRIRVDDILCDRGV